MIVGNERLLGDSPIGVPRNSCSWPGCPEGGSVQDDDSPILDAVLRLTQPTGTDVHQYRDRVASLSPTYPGSGQFHSLQHVASVGRGHEAFLAGKRVLNEWSMHTAAGVFVDPTPLEPDQTVVLWTRTLGIWVLFACRVSDVVDETDRFGFTYQTLPDHPKQGEETFMLRLEDEIVEFSVAARSRPGTAITRLARPVGKILQQRYTDRYLTAMKDLVSQKL